MIRMIALSLAAASLSSCAMLDTRPPEEIVAERASNRATLLLEGDFEGSYAFTTPGYQTLETVGQYRRRWRGAAMWTGVEVASVTCDVSSEPSQRCEVVMAITFDAPRMPEVTTHMTESWLKVKNVWYFYQPRGGTLQ